MGTVSLNITPEGFQDLLDRLSPERIPQAAITLVTGIARLLLRYAQIAAPWRTGNLRRAGFMQVNEGDQSAIVAFGTKYAGVVEGGSAPHVIAAKYAQTLAFVPTSYSTLAAATAASEGARATGSVKQSAVDAGLVIFPTHVFHPGTVANPFMMSGWNDAEGDVSIFVQNLGRKLIVGDPVDEVEE